MNNWMHPKHAGQPAVRPNEPQHVDVARRGALAGFAALALSLAIALPAQAQEGAGATRADAPPLKKDVPFVPSSPEIVAAMLKMANVSKSDVVYDLGCGDGRIVVAAVKDRGAKRGVGIDIDPERIQESKQNAKKAGVTDRTEFRVGNLFDADIKEASVVTLYLLPDVNRKLMPKLMQDLKPGTRVVSHAFDMGDWKPEKTQEVGGTTIYFWTIPERGARQAQAGAGTTTQR